MGVLEQVSQMKSQGRSEQEIINELKQQKVSPKEINDALNQSRIKDAVYSPEEEMPMPENIEAPYSPRTQDIQQGFGPPPQEEYMPQPSDQYAPPQEIYQQEAYEYPSETEQSSDMMIEVSEQVFNEKIKKVEKQIDKLTDTQAILQTQTESATERLKRIEALMDKLQTAILERVGSYGRNLESIKKEMEMIENSFTKIIPGIKTTSATHHKTSKKSKKK